MFDCRKNIARQFAVWSTNNQTLISALIKKFPLQQRLVWRKKRSAAVWQNMQENFDDQQWIKAFRVDKQTFRSICEILDPIIKPRENTISSLPPTSTTKKVAVTLYKIGSCCEYRVVGDVFGIHKSTVKKIFYETINAINSEMLKAHIRFANETDAKEIASAFESLCGIPQIIGSIDGSHIPISPEGAGYKDFINRKGWASLVLQAVVDNRCLFKHISVKYPGSVHDAAAFKGSSLYRKQNELLPPGEKVVDGFPIGYFLVGDPAYPLLPWLMKNFPGRNLIPEEDIFNYRMNLARFRVEHAFGRLKGRFRILQKRCDIHHTFMPKVIAACCILHNILEKNKSTFNPQWLQEYQINNELYPQPDPMPYQRRDQDVAGVVIRQHLKNHIALNYF